MSFRESLLCAGFINYRLRAVFLGEVAESVEGSRLLSGCGGKTSPRVRIPASPPLKTVKS
jgi:hypothetical protein